MIDYTTFCRIHDFHENGGLNIAQIAAELHLDPGTVSHWLHQKSFGSHKQAKRPSKLDAYKGRIVGMLERHPYSAAQILQRIQ